MLKHILILIVIAAMTLLVGCSTHNVTEAIPTVDDDTEASTAPAETTLEMYYWSSEADQAS